MYRFLPFYPNSEHVVRLSSFAVSRRSHISYLSCSMIALAFLFILLCPWATPGRATTYSIGPGQAYTTFTALMSAHTLTPGDIVDGGGNTFTEAWTPNGSGTPESAVTLRNFIIDAAGLSYGLVINTKSCITVTNGEIKNFTNIGILVTASSNIIVTKSYIHDGQGTGIGVSTGTTGSSFTLNKIWNLAISAGEGTYYNGIDVNNNSTGNVFYNNTIAKVHQGCVTFETGSNGNTAKNNILDSTGNGAVFPLSIYVDGSITSLTLDNNDYWFTTYLGNWKGAVITSLSAWLAATGETGPISANPVFVSTTTPDLHLQATSPCINAGVNVGLTQDYEGNPVPSVPDIGAYAHALTAPTPPTGLRIVNTIN